MKKSGAKRKAPVPSNKGSVKTSVDIMTEGENIIMSFGKQSINWFGMTKENAIEIAEQLNKRAGNSVMIQFKKMLTEWETANPGAGVTANSILNWIAEKNITFPPAVI